MFSQLIAEIAEKLNEKKITIAVAESLTGGLVSACLTSISGSSNYFQAGIVAYSNEAKIKLLKVDKNIIKNFGAVSQNCAESMALGVKKLLQTDIGLATTGIAGPLGATKNKPVGLVCFAICGPFGISTYEEHFKGNRDEVTKNSVKFILNILNNYII